MGGVMSQSFRLGRIPWARHAPEVALRVDFIMLITFWLSLIVTFGTMFTFNSSMSVLINTCFAVLLLLVHWLDVRARGLALFVLRWSYRRGTIRYLPCLVKTWLLTGKKSSDTVQSSTHTFPTRVSFILLLLCLSKTWEMSSPVSSS